MNWKLPHWVTVLGGAFLGGVTGFASTYLSTGVPTSRAQWGSFALGAAVAGLVAVRALYQTPPGKISLAIDPRTKEPEDK